MVDTQLEGLLFDLLERRLQLRLGDLNHLRRLSRARRVTMLDIALTEGRVAADVGQEIASELGIELRLDGGDAFYDQSDHTMSAFEDSADSIVDGLPDALTRPADVAVSIEVDEHDASDPDQTGPVDIMESLPDSLGPSLIRPPDDHESNDQYHRAHSDTATAPKAPETIDVSLSDISLVSWEPDVSDVGNVERTGSENFERIRQRALQCADEFMALPSAQYSIGDRPGLDAEYGTRFGLASRAFRILLETGQANASDRATLAQVIATARSWAESARDEAWMAYLETLGSTASYDRFTEQMSQTQVLDLEIDGPPAMIILYRFVESGGAQKRTRVKQFYETTGLTGTFEIGSYLAELTYSNGVIEYPFVLSGDRPLSLQISIPSMGYDRTRFALLSAGDAVLGGDHLAWNSLPRRKVSMTPVLFSRRPVSCRAYAEFLNFQLTKNSLDWVLKRVPREGPDADPLWPMENGGVRIPVRDVNGMNWDPTWPVVGISVHDALAFCHWLNHSQGPGFRLPTEDEWEWAVRGPDGRTFPWGDQWSPHHCHTRKATSDVPTRRAPRNFATDYSPYGIERLAGGVSEWTMSSIGANDERVVKGGNWSSGAIECRASSRFTASATDVRLTLGFRVVRDIR